MGERREERMNHERDVDSERNTWTDMERRQIKS